MRRSLLLLTVTSMIWSQQPLTTTARNRVLQLLREPLVRLLFPSTELIVSHAEEGAQQILDAHHKLFEAIVNRDKDAAVLRTRRHHNASKRGFERPGSME